MVPVPKAGSKPGAPGEGRKGREGEEQRKLAGKGQQARAGPQESPRDGGWTAGSPETSTARERARLRTGPGACEGPRRRQARGGRSKSRRRGGARGGRPGGRPAPRLPRPGWTPGRRGSRERGQDAGRSEQLFSLASAQRRRGGWDAGPWPGRQFFLCLKRRRCRLEERGGAGGWRLGAVPTPDARPARTRRRAGHFPEGPHLGQPARPPDSSGRGGEVGGDLCLPH